MKYETFADKFTTKITASEIFTNEFNLYLHIEHSKIFGNIEIWWQLRPSWI